MVAVRELDRKFYADLTAFFRRLDVAVGCCFEARDTYGHADLPEHLPCMGPRYGVRHRPELLSVFRGEGVALFALSWMLRPALIADYYTGTGYAAVCLAGGSPEAKVCSVDSYSEYGGPNGKVADAVTVFLQEMGLPNLQYRFADSISMENLTNGRPAQLALFDGIASGPPSDGRIIATHDWAHTFPDCWWIHVRGGSELRVHGKNPQEIYAALRVGLSKIMPVDGSSA